MQYVADCLKEIEDFKNKIVLLIAEKEKNLIAETNNKIASLKLEKEKKENYLNSLGFFAFSKKNNTKHKIEKSKSKPSAGSYISIRVEVHYITIDLHIIRPFETKIKFWIKL